jgi:hypothetical protein
MPHQGVLLWTNGQYVFDFQLPNYQITHLPNLADSLPSRDAVPNPARPVLTQSNFHALFSTRFVPADTLARVRERLRCSHAWPAKVVNGYFPVFGINTKTESRMMRLSAGMVEERPFMAAKGIAETRALALVGSPHARSALPFAFKSRSGL